MPINPMRKPELQTLVERMHLATGNNDEWMAILTNMRELLHGNMAALGRYHFPSGKGSKLAVTPTHTPFGSDYASNHAFRNPWFIASQEYRTGRVMTGHELLREEELIRTDFYQNFLKRYDIHHRLCGVLSRTDESALYLAIYRTEHQAAFVDSDKHALESLVNQLALALDHHWSLLHLESLNQVLKTVVDDVAPAILLVDGEGQVLFASRKAQDLLDAMAGLCMRGKRIAAANRHEDRRLIEAVAEIAARDPLRDAPPSQVIALSNDAHHHPLVLSAHAAGALFCASSNTYHEAVMLVIKSPNAMHGIEQCAFAQAYGLTHAQARLAGLLLLGCSLSRAAECMHISENTGRSHLKQIFHKTETHSQIELVHLHARVCSD